MVERLPGVAPPIRRSNPDSYTDTPFAEEIASVEMPRKFSFPSIKMYKYKQRMLAVALPKEAREATMCKGFGSTLIGPALQWYSNLPTSSISSFAGLSDKFVEQFASSRSLEKTSDGLYEILQHRVEPLRDCIACFNQEKVAVPECSIPTAISAFKRGLLPDGGLYKEQTMYPCKTMEDVLSRVWAQVKWKRTSLAAPSLNPTVSEVHPIRPGRPRRKILPKGIQGLRKQEPGQMGQQVKWPPKMKAPDSFRNPRLWCDFHRDHDHKTEDCVALKIKVNEMLQKGHLREFLSEKAKAHLSKEASGKSKGDASSSPPRQDRVIHVISGGSEVSGVSHAAAKKSTRNAKHGLETAQPKTLLLGTDEISFTAKEQKKILAPHHDALVFSLTIANCLVKRILVDNGSSSNIIFLTAYQDLGLEENTLTRKVTPLIGFSDEVN
ncbi:uncharacterized protein LOC117134360 [Brassica rapa]|uniref:uncharacterized protein LOC117134360 n=1 Tax=Brassica campestris TaxID=3711 RepID=UPI00142DE862|nr:uncharacterized protein LOC117134360 [Brassica rapa]